MSNKLIDELNYNTEKLIKLTKSYDKTQDAKSEIIMVASAMNRLMIQITINEEVTGKAKLAAMDAIVAALTAEKVITQK